MLQTGKPSKGYKRRQRCGAEMLPATKVLLIFLMLICLLPLISACASSSPQTVVKTRTVYLGCPDDMIKDARMPQYTGKTGDDLMGLLEQCHAEIRTHNKDQEALRAVNQDIQQMGR